MPEQPENIRPARTAEEIEGTIRAARDSVWVINEQLAKLANGEAMSQEIKGNIQRNVDHLKLIMADTEISSSDNDLSDLSQAITAGTAALPQE